MTLIASSTVGAGGAASIDFTSIPSTYTDLTLFLNARSNHTNAMDSVTLQVNGSATSYTDRQLYGTGTTTGSNTSFFGTTKVNFCNIPAASSTANTFSNSSLYLPNYTVSQNKSGSIDGASEDNTASGNLLNLSAMLWSNTAAINRVTFSTANGTFVQYSTAYLYGVKNA
jgi:hypothetical protein